MTWKFCQWTRFWVSDPVLLVSYRIPGVNYQIDNLKVSSSISVLFASRVLVMLGFNFLHFENVLFWHDVFNFDLQVHVTIHITKHICRRMISNDSFTSFFADDNLYTCLHVYMYLKACVLLQQGENSTSSFFKSILICATTIINIMISLNWKMN